jgi:hypothetical protein
MDREKLENKYIDVVRNEWFKAHKVVVSEWKEELLIRQDEIEKVESDLFESKLFEAGQMTNIKLFDYKEMIK